EGRDCEARRRKLKPEIPTWANCERVFRIRERDAVLSARKESNRCAQKVRVRKKRWTRARDRRRSSRLDLGPRKEQSLRSGGVNDAIICRRIVWPKRVLRIRKTIRRSKRRRRSRSAGAHLWNSLIAIERLVRTSLRDMPLYYLL